MEQINSQANVPLGQKEFARRRATSSCNPLVVSALTARRQFENADEPGARRLAVHLTHRHHVMLVGHYLLDGEVIRHPQTERFFERAKVTRYYHFT